MVVTDVRLPDGSGLDVVRTLRKENRTIGLVVLTMYAGDEQLFAAMDAGASGFVGKDAPTSSVVGAARQAVVAPLTFICTGLAEAMVRRMSSGAPRLSDRERQVLDLLAEGLGVSAIAGRLYLSESTAKSHIGRIYEKLGAANRAQALVMAMRLGLISSATAARADCPGHLLTGREPVRARFPGCSAASATLSALSDARRRSRTSIVRKDYAANHP